MEKGKRYVLPMDRTEYNGYGTYAYKVSDDCWSTLLYATDNMVQSILINRDAVTQADIDAAPDWVKSITPIEVKDNEQ
ncbi:hypothetical protein [Lacticaseibacillus pantheris]|uniref:hypothetical protein n=1 Tax=Lacticaseibacillus pantheris TaxID=171523 RepID=UPI0026580203|nr:hypothetical protein [Lacticaseibacillus pantheris]WKF84472.1 hypothetical protein QY874_09285 [Lacticaseibacillus pantheris]